MKRTIFALVVFLILGAGIAFAETSIKAEVDKLSLSTDEALTYKVTVVSSDKQLPQPQFPKLEAFALLSQVQSSTVSFEKGGIKTTVVYAFSLVPTAPGKYKIGPSQIKATNKIYQSESFDIEITQGKTKPNPPQAETPEKALPESDQPQYTL